ncbi:zinc finger protein 665-like [Cydia pomonella]|uniref:zinc finger protein 665-like n=1 Tax=Cydia pomonella TaxID=82600 RepID=UPI002ADD5993|nr:zinc finger protein 665-like [Cydia pomonella]
MDITLSKSSNDGALWCRACLSVEGKMYNIHEYKLADAFAHIIGSPVHEDKLPQHLCAYCGTQLLKCESFRDMCLTTQRYLVTELLNKELNTYCIPKTLPFNRPFNLTTTDVRTAEFTDTPSAERLIETDIKVEPNIDIVDVDGIIDQTDLKIESEENEGNSKSTKRKRKTAAKKKTENIEDDDEISEEHKLENIKVEVNQDNYEYEDTKTEWDIAIEDDNINFEDDFSDDKLEIMPIKKRKRVKKKIELKVDEDKDKPKVRRKRKRKEEVTRKFRKAENDFMPVFDFATFESSYGVKIVVLSKEEQLEEIASRKKSRNYLESHFRCDDCGKGYDAEAAYNNHRLRHSPSEGSLACEICFVRFKRQCVRQRHQDVHRLKFLCNECSYVSRDRGQARKHHAMHAGKTYECQHCGKSFIKSSTYLSHVRLAHPAMNVACDMCGETFIGQVGLKMHKARMHTEKIKCTICSAKFVSITALNRHTDTAAEHGDLRPCEQCGENCASEDALREHVKETHPKETHRCEECGMTFPTLSAYDVHHRRKHLNQRYSDAGRQRHTTRKKYPQTHKQGQFVCETCGKLMQNATALRTHQHSHLDIKPFACNECPKSFTLKTSLQWHMRSHTGEKPYQCPECPLAFSLKGNLDRHHKTAHLGMRQSVPCPICGRVFTTNSCVRVHIKTVHHGQPGPKRDRRKRNKYGKESLLDNK